MKEEIPMKTTEHGIEDSKDVENIYHMRLMALAARAGAGEGLQGRGAGAGDRPGRR